MTKGVRMKPCDAGLHAQRFDHLEHAMVSHALLTPPSALDLEPHDEEWVVRRGISPLCSEVLRHDDSGHFGERYGRFVAALAAHPPQAELWKVVADVQADHL
jgi:hypothetical protein